MAEHVRSKGSVRAAWFVTGMVGVFGARAANAEDPVEDWDPTVEVAADEGAWDTGEARRPTVLRSGGYFQVVPGAVAVPFAGENDFEDRIGPSYQWGLGMGWFGRPSEHFMGSIGLAFDHVLFNVEENERTAAGLEQDFDGHVFRLAPEFRLGTGGDRIFIYLGVLPGVAMTYTSLDTPGAGTERDADVGFDVGGRVGVQGLIYRGLYLGADGGTNSTFMFEDDFEGEGDFEVDGYRMHMGHGRVYLGWYF